MSGLSRREFLSRLASTLQAGTVLLASATLAECKETTAETTDDVNERADRLAEEMPAPTDDAESSSFVNRAFRNGGGFRNAGFRNGGFRNAGFRNGGFRNGGFVNGGFRNGAFRNF
jgi:rSAM-associated Gly-rich repeat protein